MKAKPYLNFVFTNDPNKPEEPETFKLQVVYAVEKEDCAFSSPVKSYTPVSGHNVFILPTALIDQKKFKLIEEKYGLKKTLDLNKADIIVRPKKISWYSTVRIVEDSKPVWVDANIRKLLSEAENANSPEIIEYLYHAKDIRLIIPLTHRTGGDTWNHSITGQASKKEGFFKKRGISHYDRQMAPEMQLFIKPKPFEVRAVIVSDTDFLKLQINKKGMIFDEQTFLNIGRLMTSDDTEGKSLIVDLMVNADYDESALYILVLFKEYYRYFPRLEGHNKKAFKVMLAYFDIKPDRLAFLEHDDIMHSLKAIGKYDKRHLEEFIRIQRHLNAYTVGLNTNDSNKASFIDNADEIEL